MKQLRTGRGFTIVEVLIVVVVIAILATIVVLGANRFFASSRDSQRQSAVTAIAESLEKYYSQNGEYPSCAALTGSADSVRQLLGLDAATIKAPAGAANSITCADVTTTGPDIYGYIGDGTTQCSTGQACLYWTLKYREEATRDIKSITSRRQGAVAVVPAAPASTTTTTISGATASASATAVNCADGSAQYRIDLQTNDGTWQAGTWGTSRARSTSTAQGAKYAYRTVTKCVLIDGTEGADTIGAADSQVQTINTPSAPVVTASATGTGTNDTVTWSWAAVTCPSGTSVRYSRSYYREDSSAWRSWLADSTTASYAVNTSYQGYIYSVKARAACVSSYTSSAYSGEGVGPNFQRVIAAPGVPDGFQVSKSTTATGYGSGTRENFRVYWDTVPTCGAGLSRRLQTMYGRTENLGGGGYVHIFNSSDQLTSWKTQWQSALQDQYRYGSMYAGTSVSSWPDWDVRSTMPVIVTSSSARTDGQSTVLTGARAYVQYACLNTDTNRFVVGDPGMSVWYSW